MKRIDRILISALKNNNRSNRIDEVFLQDDQDLPGASLVPPMNETVMDQLENDQDVPGASLAPPMNETVMDKLEIDQDLPGASLAPPMNETVMDQLENDQDVPGASLAPPMNETVMDKLENDQDLPGASLAPPMNETVMDQLENDISSPVDLQYSPLTPLVAAFGMTKHQSSEKNSSPLPPMSPKTFELFETLSKTFPSVNTEQSIDLDLAKEETLTLMELRVLDNCETKVNEQGTDYSCDTDSDYIPDSEEDSDNGNGRLVKNKRLFTSKVLKKNIYIPNSEDDSVNENSRSLLETENLQSIVNQEEVLSASTNNATNVYIEEETVDGLCNLEVHNIDSVRQNLETLNSSQKGRAKRGRKRKYPDHTLAQKKEQKYKNLPYNAKSKRVESKVFQNYACTCTRQCFAKVLQEQRRNEFQKYVELRGYEAQLLFIVNNVKEEPKSRSYTVTNNKTGKKKPREYKRTYYISGVEVCKDMFLHNFQISSKKVDVSLRKKRTNQSFKDQRGIQQGGWNITQEVDVEFIKKVINSLPKYKSHYRRENNSDCQYLKVGMTVQKIYEIYLEENKILHGESKKPVSFETLKRIFYKSFNLRCKSLKKDTCNKCDTFTQKIKNCTLVDEKLKLKEQKEDHLKRALDLRQNMNDDLARAKIDKTFECLTFDLEKTLPLPRIPTNIVFYKRQLWLYNSGIHAGSSDTGHCNIWLEGEAGRGAQEVGSCLVRYIKNYIDPRVEELALWSDCCGGQNRNIKIVLMLKALLHSHPTLQTITFKYLESGHTFLPNDTDFSKIEYQLKFHERIYTAEDYINVMKSCKKKNPLKIYRMQMKDFVSTSKIEKKIVNRKTFISKDKVNWLKTRQICIKKNFKHSIFMKIEGEIKELNIEKKVRGKALDISEDDYSLLWPEGKEIAQAKLDDLTSMFHLIPKDCLDFYKSLKGKESEEDVDGFGVEPDFEVEPELGDGNIGDKT